MKNLTALLAQQDPIPEITPNAGPFSALAEQATVILGVVCLAGLLWCVARYMSASARMKVGKKNHNAAEAEEARQDLASAFVGMILLGSVSVICGIVYGMRLT